jgi:hypothetical protein
MRTQIEKYEGRDRGVCGHRYRSVTEEYEGRDRGV